MRFISHSEKIYQEMLDVIGENDFESLIDYIPSHLKVKESWDQKGLSETELIKKYHYYASMNNPVSECDSYMGGGAYEHFIPSVVNHLGSKSEFLTSYTQYQPDLPSASIV